MDATFQSNFQSSFQSTVQSTNISFNQAKGVSINIATRIATYIATLGRLVAGFKFQGSLLGKAAEPSAGFKVYRKELRMVRTLARAVDGHPTLSNIGILLMGLALMVEIFLCA